jgi:TrmH RNA methyltransferase
MKYYGFNACEALWKNRAIDIIRVYVEEGRLKDFGTLLKWCAKQKKAYHVCTPADLEKIAASVHHEGIVILAHAPKSLTDEDLDGRLAALSGATSLIYLDGVQNPHNVGSITRLAAHFGVPLIIGKEKELPRLSPSAARVAEGAAEHVPFLVVKDPDVAIAKLKKKGYKVVVTSSHADTMLYQTKLPAKALFVFGGETAGASAKLAKLADLSVNIPGTGVVESLNVAIAAGLFLGEFWREHKV